MNERERSGQHALLFLIIFVLAAAVFVNQIRKAEIRDLQRRVGELEQKVR